jgi:hypothetical protein
VPEIVDGNIVSTDEEAQASAAERAIRKYLAGLAQLDAVDFGYAYVARLLAVANGESDVTVLAIDSRATAQSYITGMSQWGNLTAAQRQWLVVDLESRAYDAMVTRLVLLD